MEAELLTIHPENPDARKVRQVSEILKKDGIVIYPTDTIYGVGGNIFKKSVIDRLAQIKGIKADKANFSIMCGDLSQIASFTKPINSNVFRLMKGLLPGPYTFILEASNELPKSLHSKKKTIGIRIPDNEICLAMLREFGEPIITTSLHDDDAITEYPTDPDLIYEKYRRLVDAVINGGAGKMVPSTIIDCTGSDMQVVRQGAGPVDFL